MRDDASPHSWTEQVYEHGNTWAGKLASQIRPRFSLTAGSVLVLLTLLLPIGFEACGPPRKGFELTGGKGDWPTLMGLASSIAGRDFYALVLLVALFTLVLLAVSAVRPHITRIRSLNSRLAILTGAISLFLICDVTLLLAALAGDKAGPAALLPLVASCLAPGIYWTRGGFAAWISVIVIAGSSLLLASRMGAPLDEPINWIVIVMETVYAILPLGLWFRHSLSPRVDVRARWERVRRGLVAFYFFAALGNLWFLGIVVSEGLWGFIPCYFGIHLMTLGYWRLEGRRMLHLVEPALKPA